MDSGKNYTSKRWNSLDNAAKIYPAAQSRGWIAMFRLSAELCDDIDPCALAKAQESALKRFPNLQVRLKRGLFWFYFEQNDGEPSVAEDVANPCARMIFKNNQHFMFRTRYYKKRIAVEFFHVLTDGTGGMCFLKTLVAEYLRIKYGALIPRSESILDCSAEPDPDEMGDSFPKFARDITMSRSEPAAYPVSGIPEDRNYMNIYTGMLDTAEMLKKAKQYKATVTEFLTAVLICAIRTLQRRELSRKKRNMPIKICIPVNLRKFYNTNTMRNFASFVNIGISSRFGEYTLEETIKVVHHQLALETTEKMMNARIATNVITERNFFIRLMPLFIKNPTMKLAFRLSGDRTSSSTLSNLGNISLPDEMAKYVQRFDFMLGPLSKNPVACACASYGNLTCINITTTLKNTDIEREFFIALVKMGLHVKIESNKR